MKNLLKLLFLIIFLPNLQAQEMKGMDMPIKEVKTQAVSYTCPMHPEIHSPKPGNCPKCGMKLVKETAKSKTPAAPVKKTKAAVSYTCPMHPEIHSKKPGNCPKCGMTLVKEKTIKKTSQKTQEVEKTKTVAGHKMDDMKMPSGKEQAAIYTCPMHPEVHSDKPGNCPKCGMTLVKEKTIAPDTNDKMDMGKTETDNPPTSSEKSAAVTYTCPMHPEIHSDKPGNCPKCGMRLVKEKSTATTKNQMDMPMSNNQRPITYTCPMHPEIHSDKPGNCPKCGMKLVKEKTENREGMDHSGMDMDMQDNNELMANIKMAKKNLGPIKTMASKSEPRTVRYDLHIRDTLVTYGKKKKRAIAVNGQIPMPTLTFTEGDTAEIHVYNDLDEETALHWHGLFLPNKMDGVPFLTQMPIKPHSEYLYKFPIVQHGTHWYHSHSGLQEQIGMYGAFIMNKREEWNIPTIPVVISEWTDMKPEEVHRSLRSATDWFAIKKGTTQSYIEAIKTGHFGTKVTNEWKRMNAMDVSDVYYENFLLNGKNQNEQPQFKAGDKVRLRIANGGASDYFWLTYSGGKITVVASDGNDIEPVEVDRLIIAVSETYDVVLTIPENKSYEFLVTPEDRTKSASMWLGSGEKVPAKKLPTLKYFAGMKMMNEMMDMQGNMIEMAGMKMQNQEMDMNTVMYPEVTGPENPEAAEMDMKDMKHIKEDQKKDGQMQKTPVKEMQMNDHQHSMAGMDMDTNSDMVTLNYAMLRSPEKTKLPEGPWRELRFDLTGNMNRYVWSLDNKVVSETDKIMIKKGENLRIVLYNNSMMRHPMHLHGHDFRVINGQGDYAPMKNIIDIMPMEKDTIEFAANERGGDWFFHCHILYHMMSGMGRVFSYDNPLVDKTDITDPELAKRRLNSDDRKFHPMGRVGIETNGSDGEFMLAQTRWKASTLWHLGYHDMHGYESETMFGRYMGRMQWWYPYAGYDYHYKVEGGPKNIFGNEERNWFGQKSNKNHRSAAVAGVAYTLPMLFIADARIDSDGKFRFQFSREDIPVSQRLRFAVMINTDKEYMAGFRYILGKYTSLSSHYDSDMGLGVGLTLTY